MKTIIGSPKFWLALGSSLIFGLGVSVRAASPITFSITHPALGQIISGTTVKVTVATNNFALVDYKTRPKVVSGQGHIHLWLDQESPTKASAIKVVEDSYTFENVRPGNHALVAELVNNDHSSLEPPAVSTINFTTLATPTPTPRPTSQTIFLMSTLTFIPLCFALYFVNLKVKAKPNSGKQPQRSGHKSSKKPKKS